MKAKVEKLFTLTEITENELHVIDDALCGLIQPGQRTKTMEELEVAERIFSEIRHFTHHLHYPIIFRPTTDGSGYIKGKNFVPAPVKEEKG